MVNPYKAEIEWRDISKISEYSMNAKKHPDSQISKIATSISEFGFSSPILVDGDGIIIAGHGRYLAAVKLGLKKIPTLVRADLTPTQVKQLRIADNKISELSELDLDALTLDLAWLQEAGADLGLTGFEQSEVDSLMQVTVPDSLDDLEDQYGEHNEEHFWDKLNLKLPPEVMQVYEDLMQRAGGSKPHEKFEAILGAVDINALEEMKTLNQNAGSHLD